MIIKEEFQFKVIGWVVTHFRLFIRNLIRLFVTVYFIQRLFTADVSKLSYKYL